MSRLDRVAARRSRERSSSPRPGAGQVLVIMPLVFVALLAISALVVDGGQTLVLHRQAQDASDSVALAAANAIAQPNGPGGTYGCRATPGSTVPNAAVQSAATAQLAAVWKQGPLPAMQVTCPQVAYRSDNFTVQVDLGPVDVGAGFRGIFSMLGGIPGLSVSTSSRAVNGGRIPGTAAVVVLDPHGCNAFKFNGGGTSTNRVTFAGGLYVDSDAGTPGLPPCPTGGNSNVAFFSNNTACPGDQLQFIGPVLVVGGAFINGSSCPDIQSGITNPAIRPIGDPLDLTFSPTMKTSLGYPANPKYVELDTNGVQCTVIEPGYYPDGIQPQGQARVILMHPGIYYVGNQFSTQNQNQLIMSVDAGAGCSQTIINLADHPEDPALQLSSFCHVDTCGVLVYTEYPNDNQFNVKGSLLLRGYRASIDPKFETYSGSDQARATLYEDSKLVIWQAGEGKVELGGGGKLEVSGTLYAPKAELQLHGGGNGTTCPAGDPNGDCRVRVVIYRLQIDGGMNFTFPTFVNLPSWTRDYGLVK